jgi:hypothetical protein
MSIMGVDILGFHYGIMQWIWRGVNLKCIDAYAVLEWENDTKFHVFATKHKANTGIKRTIDSLW